MLEPAIDCIQQTQLNRSWNQLVHGAAAAELLQSGRLRGIHHRRLAVLGPRRYRSARTLSSTRKCSQKNERNEQDTLRPHVDLLGQVSDFRCGRAGRDARLSPMYKLMYEAIAQRNGHPPKMN